MTVSIRSGPGASCQKDMLEAILALPELASIAVRTGSIGLRAIIAFRRHGLIPARLHEVTDLRPRPGIVDDGDAT